jgi:ketosteroid isomerase-like protein
MRKTAISLALWAIASTTLLGLGGCQPAGPEANRNASSATAEPTKEPFNPAAIEAEVMRVEREWANILKSRDVEALKRIQADDIILTYPDGTTGTKADEIRDLESGAISAESYEIVESKVKVLGPDSAVISGRGVMKKGVYKRTGSKPIDISGEYRFTDVFARRNNLWQVIISQATRIDPDAVAAAAAAAKSASPGTSPSPVTSPSPTTSRTP